MKFLLTPIRMAFIKIKNTSKWAWRPRGKGTPYTVGRSTYCCSLYGNQYGVIQKLKIDLPSDLAIQHLDIYLKECKLIFKGKTCTPMFVVALDTVARLWSQPRCPTDESIKKICYIFTMDGYLPIEKNEVSFARKRMELGIII
jgi:hypothetical protein